MNPHCNPILSIICPLLALMAGGAQAQTAYEWTGGTNSSWNTTTNWNPGGKPGSPDTANFDSGADTIALDGNQSLHSFSFGNGNAAWFLGVGSTPGAVLTLAPNVENAINDTTLNFSAGVGAAGSELLFVGDAGTVNFTGPLSATMNLGTTNTVGVMGMTYNINADDTVQGSLRVGFHQAASTVPTNPNASTVANINASQTVTGGVIVAGGSGSEAGVMNIRNEATWNQTNSNFQIGYSNGEATGGHSNGIVNIGEAGNTSGTLRMNSNFNPVVVGARGGSGVVNVNNGTLDLDAFSAGGSSTLAEGDGSSGTINVLADGILLTAQSLAGGNGSANVNFDGGVLRIHKSNPFMADVIASNVTVNILSGGMTIDTQGHATGMNASLQGIGDLVKEGSADLTLNGANTFTGNTTISEGILTLGNTSQMRFVIGADGVNNGIVGHGEVNMNGVFHFDLTGAAAVGSWTIVDSTLAQAYGGTFSVSGFTNNRDGTWSSGSFTFDQSTGKLTAVP